jgi:N-acylneuraminate cytidylyltransferase
MISYAIEAAIKSHVFDEIYVSTDDVEISTIAQNYGAKVPFLRKTELSGDHVGTVPVIANFLEKLEVANTTVVACIYATNPFLTSENLILGKELLLKEVGATYVCAVCEYNYPIQRSLRLNADGFLNMAEPSNLLVHSQNLEARWHDAGQFYFAFARTWKSQKSMLMDTIGIPINKWQAVDIDDEGDWEKAEKLHNI